MIEIAVELILDILLLFGGGGLFAWFCENISAYRSDKSWYSACKAGLALMLFAFAVSRFVEK